MRQAARRSAAGPDRSRLDAAPVPVAPAAATGELRIPSALLALLAAGFVALLATAAVAIVPTRAFPTRVAAAVDGRRELLLFVALCTLALGLLLTLLVAFASS